MAEPVDNDKPETDAVPDVRDVWDWVRGRAKHTVRIGGAALGEIATVAIGLAIVLAFFGNTLLQSPGTDLEILRPTINRMVARSFDGAEAEFDRLTVEWLPSRDAVEFRASGVRVLDADGQTLQTVERLQAAMVVDGLRRGRPDLRDATVVGGEVTWLRDASGAVRAGLGTPETVGRLGPIYRGVAETRPTAGADWMENFDSLDITDSRLHIIDEFNGVATVLDVERLSYRRSGEAVAASLSAALNDGERLGSAGAFDLELDSQDALQTVDVSVQLDALEIDRVLSDTGRLSALDALDLPLSGRVAVEFSRVAGLRSASVDMEAGSGTVRVAGEKRTVSAASVKAALDPGEQVMTVERLVLDADALSLDGSGVLGQLGRLSDGDVGTSPVFDLAFRRAALNLGNLLGKTLTLSDSHFVGELDLDSRTLSVSQATLRPGNYALELSGMVQTAEDGLSALQLSGRSVGDMSKDDLLDLWPQNFADGASRWIDTAVLGGRIASLSFDVDLDSAFFAEPALTPEAVQVGFTVRDGTVRYIETMTPLTGVVASGAIDGNALSLDVSGGRIGDVTVQGGTVRIPRLMPKGGDILIDADASGSTEALLALADQPPFEYLQRYGLDAQGFGGQGRMAIKVRRPLLEFFDPSRVSYAVSGRFTEASAPFRMGEHGISNADVEFRGGADGMTLSGLADIGPWRANIEWEEPLGRDGAQTTYRASGTMDQATLDGFGVSLRQVLGGTFGVEVEARGTGLDVRTGDIALDLTPADITLGEYWSKPAGAPGRAVGTLQRADGSIAVEDVAINAAGLALDGAISFQDDFALRSADIRRIAVDGVIDGQAVLTRRLEGDTRVLDLDIKGQQLDISSAVMRALRQRGSGLEIPLDVRAEFDTVTLAPGYTASDAVLSYLHDGVAVRRMVLSGQRPRGPLTASIVDGEQGRTASVRVPDLSDAALAGFGVQSLRGGSLSLDADLPPPGGAGATVGSVTMSDFDVVDAPFLAQLLSIASLTGLFDTLAGDGLSFDDLYGDFALRQGSLSIRDGRMSGPALGMTLEGDVDFEDRAMDVEGALVPAYAANSLLSDLPVVGDIFTDKDGEGVFALTYTMQGPFERAQVTVNPLSALTPGFLRGIFRSSRDDIPERDEESSAGEAARD